MPYNDMHCNIFRLGTNRKCMSSNIGISFNQVLRTRLDFICIVCTCINTTKIPFNWSINQTSQVDHYIELLPVHHSIKPQTIDYCGKPLLVHHSIKLQVDHCIKPVQVDHCIKPLPVDHCIKSLPVNTVSNLYQ